MSDEWGVEPDAVGKLVWFVLHGGTPTAHP
jgi:hypothetical protein